MKDDVKRVSVEEIRQIIQSYQPRGLFYCKESRRCYVGVDNTTGDAWTEDFLTKRECKRWLRDPTMEPPCYE